MSSRFGTVNLPLWRPSNVPLSISGATREKGIIKSAQEPLPHRILHLPSPLPSPLLFSPVMLPLPSPVMLPLRPVCPLVSLLPSGALCAVFPPAAPFSWSTLLRESGVSPTVMVLAGPPPGSLGRKEQGSYKPRSCSPGYMTHDVHRYHQSVVHGSSVGYSCHRTTVVSGLGPMNANKQSRCHIRRRHRK